MEYRRLTHGERYQIHALVARGDSFRAIARQLSRSPSTISREIKRGMVLVGGYCPKYGQLVMEWWRYAYRPRQQKIQGELKSYVKEKIQEDWSPEQIAGRLKLEGKFTSISCLTIYRFIERNKMKDGTLWKHLRILRRQRKDRKKSQWKPGVYSINSRVMIDKRPKIVDRRVRIGDFERDTVHGKRGKSVLLTIVDRKSRLLKLEHLPKNLSQLIHQATVSRLKNEPVKTITNDNGHEFARHKETAKQLKTRIYFNTPHHSWERGTNENLNGLIRQYFPKKKDIGNPPTSKVLSIERLINSRPRKCLGYRTPYEVHEELKASVLR